jgi:hypothetical protein
MQVDRQQNGIKNKVVVGEINKTFFNNMKKNILITEEQLETLVNSTKRVITEMANLTCSSANYEKLSEFLGKKESKKIGNNTFLERLEPNVLGIRLHGTHIIEIDPTDIMKLKTNGWWTVTTKDRLNQFLGCRSTRIYQEKGNWLIKGLNGTFQFDDGIMVTSDGDVIAI